MGKEPSSDTWYVARWLEHLRDGGKESLDEFCSQVGTADRERIRAACEAAQSAFELLRSLTGQQEPELPSGSRLDEFELLEPVGKGGMGVVYRARQPSLQRDVAVKVLRAGTRPTPQQLARFRTEALATARINDPCIVKVFDVGEADGLCYLVMEFVEGHSLHEELDRLRTPGSETTLPRPDSEANCRAIASFYADIAAGLHHVHEQGVLHRDIQPKNILIDRHGKPRIIDFGLARIVDAPGMTNTGEVVGTPSYMSPEQVRAERIEIDRRTDVYSLAVVLYETLVGERAFTGSSTEQVLSRIMREEPPAADRRNAACPRALALVCQKAMQKDARFRFATAASFADELRRVAGAEPVLTRPVPALRRLGRTLRRHRAPVSAVALLAMVAVVLALLLGENTLHATIVVDAEEHRGAAVICQRFDPVRIRTASTTELGVAPLRVRLPLGEYRIWLVRGDAFAEPRLSLVTQDHEYRVARMPLRTVDDVRNGMAQITGQEFAYGNLTEKFAGHGPQRAVVGDYLIDEAEVSNAEFRAYVLATGGKEPSLWPDTWEHDWDPAWDDLPVGGVTYTMATSYANWAGKRLPTSRERMFAATGPDDFHLPWRKDPDREDALARTTMGRAEAANGTWDERWAVYLRAVVPVRSMPEGRSAWGLYHTLGNLTEMTETVAIDRIDGVLQPLPNFRMAAEPFWHLTNDEYLTARHIGWASIDANYETLGFRCAKSLRPVSIND